MAAPSTGRRFVPYADTESIPNIVVDGAPNASTVLSLTHWPGIASPPGLEADLSAQMAFRYLDHPVAHRPAEAVTNDHFDQDGVVSVLALTEPGIALRHRALLIDLAAAGDFATYRHRAAARASMAIWAYGDVDLSPIADRLAGRSYPERCAVLYDAVLPLVVPMVTEPDRFRALWADEDTRLTASEEAIATGAVTIDEHPGVDLAVVRIDGEEGRRPGHRFGADVFPEIHPMALHNATTCLRLLLVHGRRVRFVDRYETWVQYRSRRPRPRVDLRPLADHLTSLETGRTRWRADPPSSLSPALSSDDDSSLPPDTVTAAIVDHLRTAAPAWDPYAVGG